MDSPALKIGKTKSTECSIASWTQFLGLFCYGVLELSQTLLQLEITERGKKEGKQGNQIK